jgi:hypothetical protein
MLSRQTTPATANEPYFMIRVVGPITGFLFVVNCDSGRRSRRTFRAGYDRFPPIVGAKHERCEFQIDMQALPLRDVPVKRRGYLVLANRVE